MSIIFEEPCVRLANEGIQGQISESIRWDRSQTILGNATDNHWERAGKILCLIQLGIRVWLWKIAWWQFFEKQT